MILASLLCFAMAQPMSLDTNWYKVEVAVPDAVTLDKLQNSSFDVMDCTPHPGTADVAARADELTKLSSAGFSYRVVSKLEDPTNWESRHPSGSVQSDVEDYRLHYFNADNILAFFEQLRASNPVKITRQSIGTSVNGETIWVYRFEGPRTNRQFIHNNIVIEGLIHAREWISGACVMHIGRKVTDILNTQSSRTLYNQVVWIIPIVNPDGYRYTWSSNRFWRKNRRNNGGGSFGVDLNRNFGKAWGGSGSSSNPNSETYRGTAAFSEPETQAVRGLLQSIPRFGGFIDYHSYSQLVLWPWSYTTTPPADAASLNNFGQQIKSQMDLYGATYTQGQAGPTLYLAAGASKDYVYDLFGKPAFTIELRDTGDFGFDLPESQIQASQDEVWAGFNRFSLMIGF